MLTYGSCRSLTEQERSLKMLVMSLRGSPFVSLMVNSGCRSDLPPGLWLYQVYFSRLYNPATLSMGNDTQGMFALG